MEHKLISGGEQWLPFARSRIKALQASGTAYASQKFTMPDGALCIVWIEPGQEYIRLLGSSCSLMLDSGIVTFHNPFSFLGYEDGVLNEIGSVPLYHAGFSVVPPNEWRTKLGSSNIGQIAGQITIGEGRIRGKVPPDAQPASSLSAAWLVSGDTFVRNTADELVAGKKQMMTICPPSMFTGRCRLYVQSMYGLPTYKDTSINKLGVPDHEVNEPNSMPSLASNPGGAPSLFVPAFQDSNGSYGGAPVPLNTSCGVILDSASGQHWMAVVGSDTAWFYPLVANACGEGLRKYLTTGSSEYSSISDEDRTHIEAYILSSSRPFVQYAKTVSFSGGPATSWSMGYGWHWNWSGTSAVIVTSIELWTALVPATDTHMQSDYFTASIVNIPLGAVINQNSSYEERFGSKQWQFNVTSTETTKYWTMVRQYWAVLEPFWEFPSMFKVTPFHTTPFTCNAPIYAFYNVDELNVVRINITDGEVEDIITAEETGPPLGVHMSTAIGYIDERFRNNGLKLTISVGGTSYSPLYKSATWSHTRTEDGPGSDDPSYADPDPTALSWSTNTAPFTLTYSDSPSSAPTAHTISAGPGPAAMQVSLNAVSVPMLFEQTTSVSVISSNSAAIIAVPWYDAEALYVLDDNTELSVPSSSTVKVFSTPYGHTRQWVRPVGDTGLGTAYDSYYGLNIGGMNGASQTVTLVSTHGGDLTPIPSAVNDAKLHCRGGVLNALQKTTGVWDFNDDLTYSEFQAYSGFNPVSPVAIASTILELPLNIDPAIIDGKYHVFVGWV